VKGAIYKMSQSKNVQLNLSKRQIIENMLNHGQKATEIARVLNGINFFPNFHSLLKE
jgi:hypothetical protein